MRDGHGGITVGSEISGGVRNLFAEKCRLDSPNLDHALRVKNNATRGGLLENFYFRDIEVGQVAHAVITIDFNYEEGAKGNFTHPAKLLSRAVGQKEQTRCGYSRAGKRADIRSALNNCTFNMPRNQAS